MQTRKFSGEFAPVFTFIFLEVDGGISRFLPQLFCVVLLAVVTNQYFDSANQECQMWYQRIVEIEHPSVSTTPNISTPNVAKRTSLLPSSNKRKRQDFEQDLEGLEEDSEDEIHHFRRVHVVCKRILTAPMTQPITDNSLHGFEEFTSTDTAGNIGMGNDGTSNSYQSSASHIPQNPDLYHSQMLYQESATQDLTEALQQVDNCK